MLSEFGRRNKRENQTNKQKKNLIFFPTFCPWNGSGSWCQSEFPVWLTQRSCLMALLPFKQMFRFLSICGICLPREKISVMYILYNSSQTPKLCRFSLMRRRPHRYKKEITIRLPNLLCIDAKLLCFQSIKMNTFSTAVQLLFVFL
jgi:hypothetical protein